MKKHNISKDFMQEYTDACTDKHEAESYLKWRDIFREYLEDMRAMLVVMDKEFGMNKTLSRGYDVVIEHEDRYMIFEINNRYYGKVYHSYVKTIHIELDYKASTSDESEIMTLFNWGFPLSVMLEETQRVSRIYKRFCKIKVKEAKRYGKKYNVK